MTTATTATPAADTTTQSNAAIDSIVTNAKAASKKQENYSTETTATLLKAWAESKKDQDAVAKMATMLGKTTKSIVAKLSREKVYVKPAYKTKTGEAPISKEEIVSKIATLLNKTEEELESLTKATKPVLQLIEAALSLQADLLDIDGEAEKEGDSFEQLSANDGDLTTDVETTTVVE